MIRRLYEQEASYLWSRLERAADAHKSHAPLWSRDGDPRVTRLIQSAAYAFARVQEKLVDDVPEISHALVASALPETLRPFPSATVVQFRDDRKARRAGSEMGSRTLLSRNVDDAPCTFRTAWPVTAAPLILERGEVRTRETDVHLLTLRLVGYPGQPIARAVPDTLRVFVQAADPLRALDIVHVACDTRDSVVLQALSADGRVVSRRELPRTALEWTAVKHGVPHFGPADRFASGTALRTFFGFPEAFGFFDIRGLREATRDLDRTATVLEVTVRLDGRLSEDCFAATFQLDCAPAINVFEASTKPLPVRAMGPCGSLVVAGGGREVFHLERLHLVPEAAPDTPIEVRLWEGEGAHGYLDDELYVRLERQASLNRGPLDLRTTLLRPSGRRDVPAGMLVARLLATDGGRTDSLMLGDVAEANDVAQVSNITRVTRTRPAPLDGRLPWRVNAYARMPVARFAQCGPLAAYLDIHDVTQGRSPSGPGASTADAGILGVSRQPAKRVLGSEVHLGESVALMLEPTAFGGDGATWLVGELLARAIAERTDFLRFSHARLVDAEGRVRTDYGNRGGERLPPPFG